MVLDESSVTETIHFHRLTCFYFWPFVEFETVIFVLLAGIGENKSTQFSAAAQVEVMKFVYRHVPTIIQNQLITQLASRRTVNISACMGKSSKFNSFKSLLRSPMP